MDILLVDDCRLPNSMSVDIVRTAERAINALGATNYHALLLDHDLGYGGSGYDVAECLEMWHEDGQWVPQVVELVTMNPVGRENIVRVLRNMYFHEHPNGRVFATSQESMDEYMALELTAGNPTRIQMREG
jgi:hypothetical protein